MGLLVEVEGVKYNITNKNDYIECTLLRKRRWNEEQLNYVEAYINKNDNIDTLFVIGAHIGTVLLPLSKLVSTAYGFEPHSRTFKLLTNNVILNNFTNIKLFNLALGKENSIGYMLDVNNERLVNNSGGTHCVTQDDIDNNERSSRIVDLDASITITSLDLFCKTHDVSKIDILLIDIEGMEEMFLQGAEHTFTTIPPRLIICEIWEDEKRKEENMKTTQSEIIHKFIRMGYKLIEKMGDDFIFEYEYER
jgi:FkbM family methyltransferase